MHIYYLILNPNEKCFSEATHQRVGARSDQQHPAASVEHARSSTRSISQGKETAGRKIIPLFFPSFNLRASSIVLPGEYALVYTFNRAKDAPQPCTCVHNRGKRFRLRFEICIESAHLLFQEVRDYATTGGATYAGGCEMIPID